MIGINTAIESPVQGSVGIGFAVPINTAKRFLPTLIAGQPVEHPYLGVKGMTVSELLAEELGVAPEGVYIISAVPSGPAAEAGLKGALDGLPEGELPETPPLDADIVIAIDGQSVNSLEEVSSYVDSLSVGDVVELTVRRIGEERRLSVVLGRVP